MPTLEHILLRCEVICSQAQGILDIQTSYEFLNFHGRTKDIT